jgi:hypothetical protein
MSQFCRSRDRTAHRERMTTRREEQRDRLGSLTPINPEEATSESMMVFDTDTPKPLNYSQENARRVRQMATGVLKV